MRVTNGRLSLEKTHGIVYYKSSGNIALLVSAITERRHENRKKQSLENLFNAVREILILEQQEKI